MLTDRQTLIQFLECSTSVHMCKINTGIKLIVISIEVEFYVSASS